MIEDWSTIFNIENIFVDLFESTGVEINSSSGFQIKNHKITSRSWVSDKYLVAHLSILDARELNGVWMLHCCVYPHFNNPNPIYGFDIVVGKSKITGFFHDFSPTSPTTSNLSDWFKETTDKITWNRTRELPDWAKRIFSDNMIAASNIQTLDEVSVICDLANSTLAKYLSEVDTFHVSNSQGHIAYRTYISSQKNNQHTPRVLQSLGFTEQEASSFINTCLFPETITHRAE